eukprot:c17599_g2_i2.p1 GENE.c17599_g2_i2~~c17599_g2_i2.p1  ORF type:complete len:304 (-),score=48.18 c17599_g2_i2:36-896(-)
MNKSHSQGSFLSLFIFGALVGIILHSVIYKSHFGLSETGQIQQSNFQFEKTPDTTINYSNIQEKYLQLHKSKSTEKSNICADLAFGYSDGKICINYKFMALVAVNIFDFSDFSENEYSDLFALICVADVTTTLLSLPSYNYLTNMRFFYVTNTFRADLSPNITLLSNIIYWQLDSGPSNASIPSEIATLSYMTHFLTSRNKLIGSIPSEIALSPSLSFIELNTNNLNGSLPSQIALLTFLINMNINDNFISGQIPSEFGKFPMLNDLALKNNLFHGKIPTQLGLLT